MMIWAKKKKRERKKKKNYRCDVCVFGGGVGWGRGDIKREKRV